MGCPFLQQFNVLEFRLRLSSLDNNLASRGWLIDVSLRVPQRTMQRRVARAND